MKKNTLRLGIACLYLGLLCGCDNKKEVIYNDQSSKESTEVVEEIPLATEGNAYPETLGYKVSGEQSDVIVAAKTKVPRNYSKCPVVEFTTNTIKDGDIQVYADMVFGKDSYFLYMPYDEEQIGILKNKLTNIKDETDDEELKKVIEEYHLPQMDLRLGNLSGQSDVIDGEYKFYSIANSDINNTGAQFLAYDGGLEYIDACGVAGTIDGEYYIMNFQRSGNNSCFLLDRMDNNSYLSDMGSECFDVKLNGNTCTYTQEESEEIAQEFVKKLGYSNMTIIQTNNVKKELPSEYIGEGEFTVEGYNIYFAREYDSYSLAYNSMYFEGWLSGAYVFDGDGNMMIGSYECPESIRVYVDSKGVCQLELWNPWEEKGVVAENVNMISFEDVDQIAQKEFKNYADNYVGDYTIDEVVLGYTVVHSGDSVSLVPAWYYYADACDENDAMFFKNAKVIINALDGTVEYSFRY